MRLRLSLTTHHGPKYANANKLVVVKPIIAFFRNTRRCDAAEKKNDTFLRHMFVLHSDAYIHVVLVMWNKNILNEITEYAEKIKNKKYYIEKKKHFSVHK